VLHGIHKTIGDPEHFAKAHIVVVVAEADLVIVVTEREMRDPRRGRSRRVIGDG
jgi:predicted SnoaL-like aldol condensation-catalyzing enzyme